MYMYISPPIDRYYICMYFEVICYILVDIIMAFYIQIISWSLNVQLVLSRLVTYSDGYLY